MKPRYIIKDWAGNICFKGKTFKTFEDAWEYIYRQYDHLSDEEIDDPNTNPYQEYNVEQEEVSQ